jgi:hypothetical protein
MSSRARPLTCTDGILGRRNVNHKIIPLVVGLSRGGMV